MGIYFYLWICLLHCLPYTASSILVTTWSRCPCSSLPCRIRRRETTLLSLGSGETGTVAQCAVRDVGLRSFHGYGLNALHLLYLSAIFFLVDYTWILHFIGRLNTNTMLCNDHWLFQYRYTFLTFAFLGHSVHNINEHRRQLCWGGTTQHLGQNDRTWGGRGADRPGADRP